MDLTILLVNNKTGFNFLMRKDSRGPNWFCGCFTKFKLIYKCLSFLNYILFNYFLLVNTGEKFSLDISYKFATFLLKPGQFCRTKKTKLYIKMNKKLKKPIFFLNSNIYKRAYYSLLLDHQNLSSLLAQLQLNNKPLVFWWHGSHSKRYWCLS